VFLDHIQSMLFLPLVTYLSACINLTTYYLSTLYLDTFRFEICVLVDLLSPTVMSYRTSVPCFMMLSLACGLV
jgi:hypothetical protein